MLEGVNFLLEVHTHTYIIQYIFFWVPLDIQPGSLGRAGDFSLGVPLYAYPSHAGRSGSRRKNHTRGCRGESVA